MFEGETADVPAPRPITLGDEDVGRMSVRDCTLLLSVASMPGCCTESFEFRDASTFDFDGAPD